MTNLITKTAEFLIHQEAISQSEKELYCYGLELLLLSILELGSILLLAFLLGNFIETLLLLIAFCPLRLYAGGNHAKTRFGCYCLSISIYIFFSIVLHFLPTMYHIISAIIMTVFSIITIYIFAPVNICNHQYSKNELLHYRKISTSIGLITVCIILIFIVFKAPSTYILSISFGLFIETLSMITAKTQKIFR